MLTLYVRTCDVSSMAWCGNKSDFILSEIAPRSAVAHGPKLTPCSGPSLTFSPRALLRPLTVMQQTLLPQVATCRLRLRWGERESLLHCRTGLPAANAVMNYGVPVRTILVIVCTGSV